LEWKITQQKWLNWLILERRFSNHTCTAYTQDLNDFVAFIQQHQGKKISLKAFTELTLTDWRSWLAFRSQKKLSMRSTARALSVIRGFNRFIQRQGLGHNRALEQIRSSRIKIGLPKPLSLEQTEELLEDMDSMATENWIGQRDKALVTLLYGTGLRIHEALNLNGDVLPLGDQLVIRGKGGKQRVVPILPAIVKEIETYCRLCPYPMMRETPLFIGVRGGRLNPSVVQKTLRLYRCMMGLPDYVTPHALRHSCATHLLGESADLRGIQELLGHASLSTTQVYTQVDTIKLLKTYQAAHPRQKK
jgi:integrase/recombinase XerC